MSNSSNFYNNTALFKEEEEKIARALMEFQEKVKDIPTLTFALLVEHEPLVTIHSNLSRNLNEVLNYVGEHHAGLTAALEAEKAKSASFLTFIKTM